MPKQEKPYTPGPRRIREQLIQQQMQEVASYFRCRGCHSIQNRESHSQKECVTKKQLLQESQEELKSEKAKVLEAHGLKRKQELSDSEKETVPLFKIPRGAGKKTKLSPIDPKRWDGYTSHHKTKK